ncbi:arsenosugar biosynthesis radical SAM (seleno)protein ArsS [Metaclostridioides mangenotii]|uniref:arsenosugar biosynthesis radical SAM (seleno)protein ArsS n=1 Tax=Metaclostridioides mangenotii TaxID=1540 RepID=UPI000489B859|nr:arsenosugar biosynthesis radical SAM (seleno)protein ArsS [Clostridioides mangenotii]
MSRNNLVDNLEYIQKFTDRVENKELLYTKGNLSTMQLNIGKLCNLACKHCHVEAGPNRTELMTLETMKDCMDVFEENNFSVLDITGGAPEMNPNLKYLIESARKLGSKIMVRSNLVVLGDPKYADLMEFFASHKVEIVCSLPYYTKSDTDRQRGEGVYEDSISILKKLNELGYGIKDDLVLNLVYNPGGAFLPPPQEAIEREYKVKLDKDWGIKFNSLFAITNNPIGRFGIFLERTKNLQGYMQRLSDSFNSGTVESMMCRDQISIGYDGKLYDCDFNQTLELTTEGINNIVDLKGKKLERRKISVGNHCYACTAGSGSSCGGTTA